MFIILFLFGFCFFSALLFSQLKCTQQTTCRVNAIRRQIQVLFGEQNATKLFRHNDWRRVVVRLRSSWQTQHSKQNKTSQKHKKQTSILINNGFNEQRRFECCVPDACNGTSLDGTEEFNKLLPNAAKLISPPLDWVRIDMRRKRSDSSLLFNK